MTYIKLDDQITDHPAIVAAGPYAAWLFVSSLCYSSRHLTDGAIHRNVLTQLSAVPSPTRHAKALVEHGLWAVTPDGWQIVKYADWQRTRSHVESIKAKRAAAGAKGGKHTGSKPEANDQANGEAKGTPESRVQSPELPNSSSPPSVTRPTDDEDPRIGQALALIAKAKANGASKPQSWHDKVVANLRSEQDLDVEAARILERFDPPADTLAGALMGQDRRNLANYRRQKPALSVVQ